VGALLCLVSFGLLNVLVPNHMRGGDVKAFSLLGVINLRGRKAHESIGVLVGLTAH
jgi:hypothetical protein